MKGLMVPLLFFVTTGMVVGQQSPPPSSYDPGNPVARPQPDDDGNETNTQTSGPQQFGQQETVSTRDLQQWLKQVDVFEVKLDAVSLEALRQGKELTAGFSPQDSAGNQLSKDSIRAITARSEKVPSALANPIPVQGRVVLDEKTNQRIIAFPLTQTQVEGLASGQFVFRIPEQELGAYDVVALVPTFDPPAQDSAGLSPVPQDDFDSSNRWSGTNLGGVDGLDAGANGFEAPATNRSILDRQDLGNNQVTSRNLPSWDLERRQQTQSPLDQNNYAQSNPPLGNSLAGYPYGSSQRTNPVPSQPQLQRLANNSNTSPANQLLVDMKRQLDEMKAGQQAKDDRQAQTELELRRQLLALKNENDRLASQRYASNTTSGGIDASPVGYDRDVSRPRLAIGTNADLGNQSPNQNLRPSTEQTNNRLAADIGDAFKNQTPPTTRTSNDGVLFVLFLFSLAGNLYLGMLCRSLYARYGVLADELRETFSGSM